MGMATLPMPLAPLGFLIFTYLVIPKSSLVGHLSGILVGYLISSGALNPLNLYWMLSISAWMGIGASATHASLKVYVSCGTCGKQAMSPTAVDQMESYDLLLAPHDQMILLKQIGGSAGHTPMPPPGP